MSTRTGECVETLEHCVLKVIKGTEGVKSGKERKSNPTELQTEEVESVLGPGCSFSLGPTREDQGSRKTRWWNAGSGEGCGADLCVVQDQGASPKANEMELPHLLGLAGTTLGPHHKGLRKSPVKGPLSGGHKNNLISFARASKKQHRGSVPIKIREEGGRRDVQFEAPSLVDDTPRYVEFNSENSPLSLISVFGWPFLSGGSSSQGSYFESNEVVDLEPLRMVATDGNERGLESSSALVDLEEGSVGVGQQVVSVASEVSGYEKWEDNCLVKFSEFLGFPTVGFESEIMVLLRKMVARQHQVEYKGVITMSRCERELKKLVCTINYDGKNQNKGGDRERGSLMLRL